MRYGAMGKPIHHVKRINASVPALQGMLEVWCAFKAAEPSVEDDGPAYERLIEDTVLRAVATEPEAFTDSENWWPRTFEEVGYSVPRILLGDKVLYEYAQRNQAGQWQLNHPGYEDEG